MLRLVPLFIKMIVNEPVWNILHCFVVRYTAKKERDKQCIASAFMNNKGVLNKSVIKSMIT